MSSENSAYQEVREQEDRSKNLGRGGLLVLGLQHAFTMFGATVLVPYLTGVPVNVALFTAGIGTLLFHLLTKWKVPVFLGSSFAYIAPINAVILYHANVPEIYESVPEAIAAGFSITPDMIAYATGGILIAGLVQVAIAMLIKRLGVSMFEKIFPPAVAGTIIAVIGLNLAPTAISMASSNWWIAIVSLGTAVFVRLYAKGFTRLIPVMCGIVVGYIVAAITGNVTFDAVSQASWVGLPQFVLPKFSFYSLTVLVPVALAPTIEHFADIFAVSAVVGKKYYEDPGIHRTLAGDGIATAVAGFFGGPANTTYSENTGVLAITKVFNPVVMRIAAVFAIILSFVPKVGALIQSIPTAVMGGIEILLFGMIAAIGMKTLIENRVKVDGKNLIIISVMLVVGIGGAAIGIGPVRFEGIGLAALVGLLLNGIFVMTKAPEE
ncbi:MULTISPECIES: uracil-xanthine permease family protein [Mesotoga]|uniref:uracil-xanthine permease family protein n=2 Tax=Kosmotogaceae TaxID=1643948 RepID=UPI0002C8B5FF|nr:MULTISPECIES: uracil-xanthine permease family protein [Mesotoga]MCP5456482.1 uracil-xanthine permease [Thermotogota bacterium]CCU85746.1 putative uracil permease [Mesotoga infera]MCP5460443.1 uracil-xanthine permease [Thermotogota bacterium]MDK2943389.1 uracil permease [Mesotoga sp.]HNQ70207.1 uracil-xanthine permease family protein [Mesotoga prima]